MSSAAWRGLRVFAGENKGRKLLQELGQGWGVPGSPAATGTARPFSAGHNLSPQLAERGYSSSPGEESHGHKIQ